MKYVWSFMQAVIFRKIFSKQKVKLYTARMITCDVQNCPRTENTLPLRKPKEAQAAISKQTKEQREICFIIQHFVL